MESIDKLIETMQRMIESQSAMTQAIADLIDQNDRLIESLVERGQDDGGEVATGYLGDLEG